MDWHNQFQNSQILLFLNSFILILYWIFFKLIQSSLDFCCPVSLPVTSCSYRTLLWDFWGNIQDVVYLQAAWSDIHRVVLWALQALFFLQRCKWLLCNCSPLQAQEITSWNVFLCFQGIGFRVWGGFSLAGIVFLNLALEIHSFLHGTDIARIASQYISMYLCVLF